ncbi:DUF1254 domain-containing protein [Cupriavidus basilensis]
MLEFRVAATVGAAVVIFAACTAPPVQDRSHGQKLVTPATVPTDQQISDAYLYLLGRLLILRQERQDFEREGFRWNQVVHRAPGAVAWANPNLDVAYSEAWVAVDETSCVQLDIPKIAGRYYTWQMLNGWGRRFSISTSAPIRPNPMALMRSASKALRSACRRASGASICRARPSGSWRESNWARTPPKRRVSSADSS